MPRVTREEVWERAGRRCEYCHMPQSLTHLPHEIDHIRPKKHHGRRTADNLCLACALCNGSTGTNVTGFDPDTDALVTLFHPRRELWNEHFMWDGPILLGRTPNGRATIDVLAINLPARVFYRQALIERGRGIED